MNDGMTVSATLHGKCYYSVHAEINKYIGTSSCSSVFQFLYKSFNCIMNMYTVEPPNKGHVGDKINSAVHVHVHVQAKLG